jgi:membrane protease YdiL (CAAX protease family)
MNEPDPGAGQLRPPFFVDSDREADSQPQAEEAKREVQEVELVAPDLLEEDAESPASEPEEPSPFGKLPGPGLLAAIGWLVVLLLVQLLIIVPLMAAGFDFRKGLFPLALVTLSGFLAAPLIVGLNYGRDFRRALALRAPDWSHVGCLLALAPPLLVVGLGIVSLLDMAYEAAGVPKSKLDPNPIFGEFLEGAGQLGPTFAVLLIIVFAAVLPALWEELYLRGFLGRGLVARWGVVSGVALTSILFGALHLHPTQSVVTALLGIVLHTAYLWSRSLFAPMLLHAANNSLALLIAFVLQQNSPSPEDLEDGGLPWLLLLAAFLCVAAVGWIYYKVRVRWVLPDGSPWTPGYVTAEMPPAELGAKLERQRVGRWPLIVMAAVYCLFISVLVWEVLQ